MGWGCWRPGSLLVQGVGVQGRQSEQDPQQVTGRVAGRSPALQSVLNWPQPPQVKGTLSTLGFPELGVPRVPAGWRESPWGPILGLSYTRWSPRQPQLHDSYPFYGLESWLRLHLRQGSYCLKK